VVEANLNGEMNLKIETDLVSATTHFKDLGNPPWGKNICKHLSVNPPDQVIFTEDADVPAGWIWATSSETLTECPSVSAGDESSQDGGPSQSRDPELMAEATVDIRKLQQFLVGQQVNPSKAMCSKSCSNRL
ncbi:hypothetical protein GOODEAATRI_026130, partial [Goodea atripinnis]